MTHYPWLNVNAEILMHGLFDEVEPLRANLSLLALVEVFDPAPQFAEHLALDNPLLAWITCLVLRVTVDLAPMSFETAFQKAKYKAGMNQYKLLNHYIETAAKLDNRKAFNKGLQWANYIGIEVRWLRDKEQTEQNIDFAYACLRHGRYAI